VCCVVKRVKDVRLHPSGRGVRLLDAAHAQMHAHGASERAWQVSSRASVTAASECDETEV